MEKFEFDKFPERKNPEKLAWDLSQDVNTDEYQLCIYLCTKDKALASKKAKSFIKKFESYAITELRQMLADGE